MKHLARSTVATVIALVATGTAFAAPERRVWSEGFQSSPGAFSFVLPQDLPEPFHTMFLPKPPITGTILPFTGAPYYSSAKDGQRQRVNAWIRTSGLPDTVIDFEALMRDPRDPSRLRPEFDSGDHLHPNDAGYKAMGDAIDLKLID